MDYSAMTRNQLEAEKARANKNFCRFAEAGQIAVAQRWQRIESEIDAALLSHEDPESIASLLASHGLGQSEFSRLMDIPLRTVQDWCSGRRTPPVWQINLLRHYLEHLD